MDVRQMLWPEALGFSFVSMLLVFLLLALLAGLIALFRYLPGPKLSKLQEAQPFGEEAIEDETMLAAIMVACMEAAGEDETAKVRVLSARRIQ